MLTFSISVLYNMGRNSISQSLRGNMKFIRKSNISKSVISLLLLLAMFSGIIVFSFANVSDSVMESGDIKSNSPDEEFPEETKEYRPKMSITLDSDFIVNIYVPSENTVNFTFDGILYENLQNYSDTKTIDGKLHYKISKPLPAAEAAEELMLSVSTSFDNQIFVGSFTFSIPKYAAAVLSADYSTDVEKTLVNSALAYIVEAYSYFECENAAEVSESISAIIGKYTGSHTINSFDSKENHDIKYAAFVLDATPGIKFYIDDAKNPSSYDFYANNKQIKNVTEGEDDNGKYLLLTLAAYEMCGTIRYTVDGVEKGSYGINNYYSYISKKEYADERKEELRDLLRKFYNYSISAADYYIQYHNKNDIKEYVDIKDYALVYPKNADVTLMEKVDKLASAIENVCGIKPQIFSDESLPQSTNYIFVGNSSKISNDVYVKLSQSNTEDAFILDFTKSSVAVFGKTQKSSARAIEYFIENYVNSANNGIISLSDGNTSIKHFIALENGSEIVVESTSTVFGVKSGVYNDGLYPSKLSKSYYPSVIELKHNGENNGKLIAILAVNDTPTKDYEHLDTNACVMESSDGGKTWKMIARPQETINPTFTAEDGTEYAIQGISMAHIYELPAQVGDMPAGTLLYSGTSVNYDCYSQVAIWRSFDCGYTWEEYTVVATGGGHREGVWEPFTWYEPSDGYLYFFYSDDSDPLHDQKLVFKRSEDGVNWSEEVGVCVFNAKKARPGMLIMTRMGSGEYLMVYEYFSGKEGQIFYKITDDITDWNPEDPGTLLKSPDGYTFIGAPSCIWTPTSGENGTLIVSGKADYDGGQRHLLFVSFDYGRSWTTIENPLPYDITLDAKDTNRIGHSASFTLSSDPSVIYYLNTTVNPENGYQRVECAKIKIYQ